MYFITYQGIIILVLDEVVERIIRANAQKLHELSQINRCFSFYPTLPIEVTKIDKQKNLETRISLIGVDTESNGKNSKYIGIDSIKE